MRKGIRLVAQLLSKEARSQRWASPCWIPLQLLPRFGFACTQLINEPDFLPTATIFDYLRDAGLPWYFHGVPNHRVAATRVKKRFLTEFTGHERYAFVHIGDLDGIGHRYGPWSVERKNALSRVDLHLSQIIAHAQACVGQVDILILGDHGMVQVKHSLDVTPAIERLKARGLVFDYFIDATLFRCWSKVVGVLEAIRDEFSQFSGLIEIGESEALRYGLRYTHNRFWDACWQAEEGLIFRPNFHNNDDQLLGMHGYLPESVDNRSAFVLNSPRLSQGRRGQVLEAVDMRRFFATQLTLLDMTPASIFNESLI
jgi:predicted AlkP superfamily pyrophosphatase or phosphodiesterase